MPRLWTCTDLVTKSLLPRYDQSGRRLEDWHWHAMLCVEGHAAYGWLYQNLSYWKECLFPELDPIHNKNIEGGLGPDSGAETYRQDAVFYPYPEPPMPYDTYEKEDDMLFTRGY